MMGMKKIDVAAIKAARLTLLCWPDDRITGQGGTPRQRGHLCSPTEANDELISTISKLCSGKVSAHLRKNHHAGNSLIGRLDDDFV